MGKYSQHTGITKNGTDKWRCVLRHNSIVYNIGYFDTEIDAIEAREAKKIELGIINYVIDLDGEIWGYCPTLGDGYVVSDKGRIKALNFRREGREKLLKQSHSRNKLYFELVTNINSYRVHRLVMETFIGDSDLQVNHKDKNGFNNDLENLEYVSNRENNSHKLGGAKGCCYTRGHWMAAIKIDGKSITLGYYKTYTEAHQRYIDALSKYGIENKYVKV
jgi:hypothetical protein